MTQRIFDVENEKDMQDLWDILQEDITRVEPFGSYNIFYSSYHHETNDLIKINWYNKTEITRPIQEATEADIGKICKFWSIEQTFIGELSHIENTDTGKYYEMYAPISGNLNFLHCRRLTKQEIEELY